MTAVVSHPFQCFTDEGEVGYGPVVVEVRWSTIRFLFGLFLFFLFIELWLLQPAPVVKKELIIFVIIREVEGRQAFRRKVEQGSSWQVVVLALRMTSVMVCS